MNSLCKTFVLIGFLITVTAGSKGFCQSGYDSIVDELSSRSTSRTTPPPKDYFEEIKIYFGAGWINSFYQPAATQSKAVNWHSGMILSLGIDLFSRHWMAEGSIKNFGTTRSSTDEFTLRDFDLKLIHQGDPWSFARWRWGVGVGGRYLTHKSANTTQSYTTPYALAMAGLVVPFSDHLQLGGDIVARTALIQETIDKSSVDFSLKLDTFF